MKQRKAGHAGLAWFAVVALAGCVDPQGPTDPGISAVEPGANSTACAPNVTGFKPRFECDQEVRLASSTHLGVLVDAAAAWSDLTDLVGITFSTTSGSLTATLVVSSSDGYDPEGTTIYCGTGGLTITIMRYNPGQAGATCGSYADDLLEVVIHEFGHTLGYTEWRFPPTDPCVMDLTDYAMSSSQCVEEREVFRWAYGLRGEVLLDSALATGVNIRSGTTPLSSLEIEVSDIVGLNSITACVTKPNRCYRDMTFAWSSSDPSVMTVSGTGANATITGVAAGTAQLTVDVTGPENKMADYSGAPPAVAPGGSASMMTMDGPSRTITVQVTAPPPPVPTTIDIEPQYTLLETDGSGSTTDSVFATVYDQYGQVMTNQTLSWSIDYTTIAKFYKQHIFGNPTGHTAVVVGQSTGNTPIRASIGSVTGTAVIQVNCHINNTCIP